MAAQPEEKVSTTSAAATEDKLDFSSCKSTTAEDPQSVTSSSDPSATNVMEQEGEVVCDDSVLSRLAKQLEYYFSKTNLSKDAYVQTLRELNDSYVPVSILANFQMVKRLVPYDAMGAIVRAAKEFSSLLEIVFIDTKTGKRVEEESSSTIWAVGSISREPLDYTPPSPSPSPARVEVPAVTPSEKSPVQNTVILREVDDQVTEDEVRALFESDPDCPAIQSVHLDVANCWFVVLDTSSRDDMLNVMMQLRTKKLGGNAVKARVKSSARQIDSALAPPLPVLLTPSSSLTSLTQLASYGNGSPGRKKKKKTRSKNKNNNNNNNNNKKNFPRNNSSGNINGNNNNNNNNNNSNNRSNKNRAATKNSVSNDEEPILTGAEFPALGEEKVELVGVENGMEDLPSASKSLSDAASTATTASTSSSLDAKKQQQLGGYAAALLKSTPSSGSLVDAENNSDKTKAKPSQQPEKVPVGDEKSEGEKVADDVISSPESGTTADSAVVITPPSWGSGKSFADVLKEEEAAAASAATGLAC